MRHKIIFLLILIILGLIFSGCRSARSPVLIIPDEPIETSLAGLQKNLTVPQQEDHPIYKCLAEPTLVYQFYQNREFKPLWFTSTGESLMADSMLTEIKQARYKGLFAKDFHLTELKSLQDSLESFSAVGRMDVLYTDAFLIMLHQVKNGRMSNEDAADSLRLSFLKHVEDTHALKLLLDSQEPTAYQYHQLKEAMALVLNKAADSVRAKLLEGEILESSETMTLVRSIEINLERWRAMQVPLGNQYLLVNIPAYTLYLIKRDSLIFQSKVVVGKPESQTPQLSSIVECFVLFPYWYVPRSILVGEYLPLIQRDPSFITRNNFDVLNAQGKVLALDSIPWKDFHKNYLPVSLRQREGSDNSLGLIKFVFDNPYAVFLHDTNAKSSFKKSMRALSHGCVRIEDAFTLAHYLLTGDMTKESATLNRYLKAGERRTLNLHHPIPIHLAYVTCEFLNGNLYLYPDIYQLDTPLIQSFYSRALLP